MKLFVSGLVNRETVVPVKSFPIQYFPIDYPFFKVNTSTAGVGFNVAKALTTLGDDVQFFSYTGNDAEGKCIDEELRENNISTEFIQKELKATASSVVLYDGAGKRQVYCDLKDVQDVKTALTDEIQESIKRADLICACNINFSREILRYAVKHSKTIATDVHVLNDIHDAYNKEFMANVSILFLSDENVPCNEADFILQLAEEYKNLKIIVLGQGSKGASLYERINNKIVQFQSCKPTKIVNTVGAGDALFSCFIHFYAKGKTPEECLSLAQKFAAIKIGSDGAAKGFVDEKTLKITSVL